MNKTLLSETNTFRFRRFDHKSYSAYNSMHRHVTIGVLSVAIVMLSASRTAAAQGVPDSVWQQETLQTVNVSASLSEPPNQAGRVVAILTRQDIENVHAESVQQLLTTVSGIDMQQRGAGGVQADISLRGGNFDQTAVLLNGVNVSNPHTGHYSFDIPVNLDDIERIEIIKGPTSIIYGASAFSGGINIITKKGIDKGATFSIEAGQHAYSDASVAVARKWGRDENYLSFSRKSSSGYIDNSDYEIYNALYQNRVNLKHGNIADFQIGYNRKDYGANTFYSARFPNQHELTSSFLASAKGMLHLSSQLQFSPTAYYNLHTDEFQLIKGVSTPNYHLSHVVGNNLVFRYRIGEWWLNFGSDVRYEGIRSSVLGDIIPDATGHYTHKSERINLSYFIQINWQHQRWLLTGGLMSFQNTKTPQGLLNCYPSMNINYTLSPHWTFYCSFSSASRLPTYTELYYSDAVHVPNPDLKQEKSISAEAGVRYTSTLFGTSANIYYMQGRDMIDWMKDSASQEQWQSRNINTLNKSGMDLSFRVYLDQMMPFLRPNTTLLLGYSHILQQQTDVDYISAYALNYLRDKITGQLVLPFTSRITLTLAGRYCARVGTYVEYTNNVAGAEESYEPYFVLDAALAYAWCHFTFHISATNLLDADYFDIGNIPQPGCWLKAGIRFKM